MVASICQKYAHFIKFAGNTYKLACNQFHYIQGVEKKTHTHTHTHTHKWVIRIYICWIEENKLAVSQDLMIF
jgi:hypothetical protein